MAERLRKIGLSDIAINFLAKLYNDGKKFRAAVKDLPANISKDKAFGQLANGMGGRKPHAEKYYPGHDGKRRGS